MRSGLLLLLMTIAATPAFAVYKCDTREGLLYTDIPCTANQAALPPPPRPSDPAAARQLAANDKKQLALIDKEETRLRSEYRRQETGRDKLAATRKRRCILLGLEKKWSAEDAASAAHLVSEKSETSRRHARRRAERFEAECQMK